MFTSGDARLPLPPDRLLASADSGLRARVGSLAASASSWPFRFDLTLNGRRSLLVVPAGSITTARLDSAWPDPSFAGRFLPAERTVGPQGFSADWQVTQYGRSFPPTWTAGEEANRGVSLSQMSASALGDSLLTLLDAYRTVERSIKYDVLFIVLVFTVFFVFEAIAGPRIRPLQYLLVGAALCLFFLGLLSLSEFVPFGAAYAAAAAASTGLITGYSARVLQSGRRSRLLAAMLVAAYGVIFVALRLQDYSLLFGSAMLFAALGDVMYATRNMDWYAVGRRS